MSLARRHRQRILDRLAAHAIDDPETFDAGEVEAVEAAADPAGEPAGEPAAEAATGKGKTKK